jgi:hypothetical protein
MNKMNLRGGVIMIGSLWWDSSLVRRTWRDKYLSAPDKYCFVDFNIRYGRQAGTRSNTYTMIYNNHPSTQVGKAIVWPFKYQVQQYAYLEEQAYAIALAEGICEGQAFKLVADWGAVAILVNPKLEETHARELKHKWQELYGTVRVDSKQYAIEGEQPVIDDKGFFQLDWRPEMDQFDFLIGTAIVPKPHRLLCAKEIACNFIDQHYRTYFDNNLHAGLRTFQDEEILFYLEKE